MITVIRRKAKSRLFRVILLIIVFSMTIGGSLFVPELFRQISHTTKSLITVNEQTISPAHFAMRAQHEYERVETFRQQFGEQADMFLRMLGLGDPQQMAYNALIQEALLNSVASKLGLPLDEGYIARQLQNPSFVLQELTDIVSMYVLDRDGTINIAALRKYLQQLQLTMSDFEQLVENALRRSTALGLLHSTAYVDTSAVRERFIHQYIPKNFVVMRFPLDRYLQKARQINVSDEELKAFFHQENETHKRYWIPEKRTGIVAEFSPDHFDIVLSRVDIENYYNKHKHNQYVQSAPQIKLRRIVLKVENEAQVEEVHNRMLQLKEELNKNSDLFEEYAKKYSQEKSASQPLELLPWYTRSDLKPIIGTAAFNLAKDKDISDVLRTDEGYELIQRIERKPKEFKSLDIVKDEIEKTLKKQRFSDKFKQIMKQKISHKMPLESLKELIKKYNAQEKLLNNVTLEESRINKELFKLKENDTTYYIDNGTGFVILLQNISKSHVPTFESVKNQVKENWYQHKAQKMLSEDLQKAEQLALTKNFEEVSRQFNATLEHIEGFSFDDKKMVEIWNKKGYPVADFYAMRYPSKVALFKKDSDGFLVKFLSNSDFNQELFNKKRNGITQELYQETRERLQRGFVASLQRHATIKTSDDFHTIRNVK